MRIMRAALMAAGVATADPPKPDIKPVLMDADWAFAKATAEKGLDGWVGFMAEDVAKTRRPGEKLTAGKEAGSTFHFTLPAAPSNRQPEPLAV